MKATTLLILAGLAIAPTVLPVPRPPQAQETAATRPAQALRSPRPGEVLDAGKVDFIEEPGHYGLGADLRGSRYAIAEGHLVRVDPDSLEIQSVLRDDIGAADEAGTR